MVQIEINLFFKHPPGCGTTTHSIRARTVIYCDVIYCPGEKEKERGIKIMCLTPNDAAVCVCACVCVQAFFRRQINDDSTDSCDDSPREPFHWSLCRFPTTTTTTDVQAYAVIVLNDPTRIIRVCKVPERLYTLLRKRYAADYPLHGWVDPSAHYNIIYKRNV